MITLIVALTVAAGSFAVSYGPADFGLGWSVFFAILAFGVFQGVTGFFLRRRVKRDMEYVQEALQEGQRRLQAKMQRWQVRNPGSVQAAQKEMFDDMRVFVKEALARTAVLEKYRLWVPMMVRQIATARMQLSWMIKDFKRVDELMPKALLVDPTVVAMKMTRLYLADADMKQIEALYRKGVRRVRYNGNVLLAATWSWMLVQKGDAEGAFKALTEALGKSDNETLKRNHEMLMNNRVAHFSNSGIGDAWYSLYLEEPKVRVQRARPVYR